MTGTAEWRARNGDPLFILAMDHRDSFGKTLFAVANDNPSTAQLERMRVAKQLIFDGLLDAAGRLPFGRPGCLVDEQYGQGVIDAIQGENGKVVLAIPIEASGHDWFTLQWGSDWAEHLERARPDYAKVLVRDNPDFDPELRAKQLDDLAAVSTELSRLEVPLLYELLVPATDTQLAEAGGDELGYDRDLRPDLVIRVIAENQQHGVEPALWKVEGLETVDAAARIADQARAGGRDTDLVVLGRDAPADRLENWLRIASQVEAFVGFAIGRSIWQDVIAEFERSSQDDRAGAAARNGIAARYLGFVAQWRR